MVGYIDGGRIDVDQSSIYTFQLSAYTDVWQIFFVPLEDYNRLMGQNETLDPGEVLLYTTKSNYEEDSIALGDGEPMKVKKVVPDFADNGVDAMQMIPSMYIFVPDFNKTLQPITNVANWRGSGHRASLVLWV
ncbi:MAG: hypothetical protein ACLTDS_01150 [Bianqueaceae bacterium]